MDKPRILRVAINVPLSRQFDYRPPRDGVFPEPGCRVLVPFGKRRCVGIVLAVTDSTDLPDERLRRSISVLDEKPLLADDDLRLIRFTADYYHHPIGEVAAAALPALLRQGKPLDPAREMLALGDAAAGCDTAALARRAPRQAELLELVGDAGAEGIGAEALTEALPAWRRAAKPLLEKGLLRRFEIRVDPGSHDASVETEPGPTLNSAQSAALESLRAHTGFSVAIIDGVTGSGKTEVYLRLIGDVLARGRQVLVLVPEIGLTPQLVVRLRERLGMEPAVLHSGLSDLTRLAAWRAARAGAARLVLGTRSAVFTPLPKLGLIVVDEEHDQSFKQQEGLRYSARDLAITRAKHRDVPIVLGSATPSLEMLQHCLDGQYERLVLPERAGGAQPPAYRLIDLERAPTVDGLSEPLLQTIADHLEAGGQALMFLNRRGFAPTLICAACGHVAECRRCDSRMTVHAHDSSLRCHHCGASRALDSECGDCGSAVRALGAGTERLEDTLSQRFPERRIQRIDSDTTQQRGSIHEALEVATAGDADILVGTQMLSKGHHFPNLTLVGIVNADQGLFGTDFRAPERLAQSIVQVAGRAGRESRPGEVLIQTAFARHAFWQHLIEGGYARVAEDELRERAEAHWPPFSRLVLIRSAAHRQVDARRFLDLARDFILQTDKPGLRLFGPVNAPMARRAGRHRAQLLLQSTDRQLLHALLRRLRAAIEDEPRARRVQWSIDVDPVELV